MSDQNRSWNNVPKRKKKKRQYDNKKRTYPKDKSSNRKKYGRENSKEFKNIISKNEFPSLPKTKIQQNTTCQSLVLRKGSLNPTVSNKNTIYVKAKNGSLLLSSYPIFHDSPEPPLFQ